MVLISDLLDPASISPLVCLDVKPCDPTGSARNKGLPTFLAAAIKLHLLNLACEFQLSLKSIHTDSHAVGIRSANGNHTSSRFYQVGLCVVSGKDNSEKEFVFWLPQHNPNLAAKWPCRCHGYVETERSPRDTETRNSFQVSITEATLVRVDQSDPEHLDFGTGHMINLTVDVPGLLDCHNPETAQELLIHLKRLVAEPISIGIALDSPNGERTFGNSAHLWEPPKIVEFKRDGALLVHSPEHGAGKTLLVEHLARKIGCSHVHKLHIGPLISKYGIHADAALESHLHQKVLQAAMQNRSVCIILDDFSAMVPSALSGSSGAGDATSTVLSSVAAYLRLLTFSLFHLKTFPFPTKNPMYNIHGNAGGCKVPVRLCLVAIATCPDDGWSSANSTKYNSSTNIFNLLEATKYRLPPLNASTRLKAFRGAMQNSGIAIDPELDRKLPQIAASAVWACGADFRQVAECVKAPLNTSSLVSVTDFVSALQNIQKSRDISGAGVVFVASQEDSSNSDTFGSIGGNKEAKLALEEALAMGKEKRALLGKFGMSPPNGVLLFGPPGNGKTLLAKAVAKLLESKSASGGAFVAINSTDVASAEVGTGEKLLARAFDTARSNSPAVIFIDEFQALFTDRNSGGSSRLTSTLLTALDDCKKWADLNLQASDKDESQNRVVVLAATNTPWMIDRALLRPGRFDRIVHVGLPQQSEREAILDMLIGKMNTNLNEADLGILCKDLALKTHNYSGADLAALCRTAAIHCLITGSVFVGRRHFEDALHDSAPSRNVELVEQIKQWRPGFPSN